MELEIRLFAGIEESLGTDSIRCNLPNAATVSDLVAYLRQAHPQATRQIEQALVAVNRRYAIPETVLNETDEIALIPPVGGGSDDTSLPSCLITTEPLDLNRAYEQLIHPSCGGVATFCGTVREWTQGRQTKYLTYQAYKEMAEEQMRRIEYEVSKAFPGTLLLQWHRIGHLHPTETAVICGAASPHRDVAFDAARMLIERLKKEVPIWKKEFYNDGETTWQPNESPN